MRIAFTKYHGAGNDFIIIDALTNHFPTHTVPSLCDRHCGIGADGILLLSPDPCADIRMIIYNADGSCPEMCANGLRCAAFHIASRLETTPQSLPVSIATDSGTKNCVVYLDPAFQEAQVTADIGPYSQPERATITIDGTPMSVHTTSLGNPHAVLIDPPAHLSFAVIAPALATHAAFPQGTNVSFATSDHRGLIVQVWERGVGPTLACGTAACAVAAVAAHTNLIHLETAVPIALPGGILQVTITEDHRAILRGPARRVFQGVITL